MRDGSVPRLGGRFPMGRLLTGDMQHNTNIQTAGAFARLGVNGSFDMHVDVTQAPTVNDPARVDWRDVGTTEAQNPLFGSTEQPDSLGRWFGLFARFRCDTAYEANLGRSIMELKPRDDPGDAYSPPIGASLRLFVRNSSSDFAMDVQSDETATGSGAPPVRTELFREAYDTNEHSVLVRFRKHYTDELAWTQVWWDGVLKYSAAIAQTVNNPTAGREDACGFSNYVYGNAGRPTPPVNNPLAHIFVNFQFWEERPAGATPQAPSVPGGLTVDLDPDPTPPTTPTDTPVPT